ncbi:hypothetical protein PHYSODRAFT_286675 [Phytophthora sojae]|uniref:RxLR effector protein n=2 Tax=Phytophthora sojae TaxID=67593 RepID=G4ZV93_PHYSP|nr:hypothetical protein PHYSODRAFT_286675 [Phytophthora sojae]AEK81183.1 Avh332 [Phytophthora sojae]AEK81184.1 Avh332 [Phytophthora sojae]AEK81185.1 Avh332 [Phytophthora sojae]EGZ13717.1 hypothetical protein PHYSODRAFT_286675 [Phytophthora sojae]|eukprot:XP_009531146.1 hypothetical protein PHYSODRAFT_286675 [Phytophthora sojae]
MRVLSLLTVIALVSSCEAATSATTGVVKTDITFLSRALTAEYQPKRSLRQYDEDELATLDSEDEERAGTSQKMEELVEKFGHLGFTTRGFDTPVRS